MSLTQFNNELFNFLHTATTAFHAVDYLSTLLIKADFIELHEKDKWHTEAGKNYFCIRDNGSLLVFKLAAKENAHSGWKMLAAHTDSPSLQIKPQPGRTVDSYDQLGVEVYGGPILASWFDRDLGIAGRVTIQNLQGELVVKNIDFKKAVAVIPSLAIHLNREVNKNYTIKRQKHLLPLVCQLPGETFSFQQTLQKQVEKEHPETAIKELLGFDLFCHDTQAPQLTGLADDFISASRLDNLVSCFCGIKSILQLHTEGNCLLLCSNHEEIGSSSVAGAQGNFLSSALTRLIPDPSKRFRSFSSSHFISMDNAHALHPNFKEKHDPQHLPLLNHGPVIKYNANQRYASTCRSAAMFKTLCLETGVPVQEFVMQNDLACGSTIGPIAATELGIQTVDVGIPSLAMHSIRETTGAKDPYMFSRVINLFLTRPL